jgi:hypothetical protein
MLLPGGAPATADVVGFGDVEVGVEPKGALPVVVGAVGLAGALMRVSEAGVGSGLLVSVTCLDGQDERAGVVLACLVALPGGVQGLAEAVEGVGSAGAVAHLAVEVEACRWCSTARWWSPCRR